MDTGHVVNKNLDLTATMFAELEVEENEYAVKGINKFEGNNYKP